MNGHVNLIGADWQRGRGAEFSSHNPATGDRNWCGRAADGEQVSAAVSAAREAFPRWAARSVAERIALVRGFGAILESNREGLTELLVRETGRTRWDCAGELSAMIGKIDISVQAYHERSGERDSEVPGARSVVRHRPHGVLAVFGPYNFPAHLPNGHIVPALIAGNTVVFKPSELAPMSGEQMAHWWLEAGLPAGVVNLVQGERDTGHALASDPGIDGLLFTGSARTGKLLHSQLGGQPEKILALEMGGNNPLIVRPVADRKAAVYAVLQSSYLSAGQRCSCARRLLIADDSEGDALIEALAEAVGRIQVGAPDAAEQPFMGPLISERAADDMLAVQEQLVALGGRALVTMTKLKAGTGFLSPGLMDVSSVTALPDEEYFGPFAQIIRYRSFHDALRIANDTRFGLAAGLLSDSAAEWEQFRQHIRAGIVNWNRPTTGASSAAPFGGPGASGNYRPSGYYAADYCAYPVASFEAERVVLPDTLSPGLSL